MICDMVHRYGKDELNCEPPKTNAESGEILILEWCTCMEEQERKPHIAIEDKSQYICYMAERQIYKIRI